MFVPVPGVPAAPPTTGLVASAVRPPDDGDTRWETGLAWIPQRCGTDYQLLAWCDPDGPGAYTEPRAGGVYHRPVGVRFAEECSTMGGALDTERLRRTAEATTPFVVARELWTGALSQTDPFTVDGETLTNTRLADTDADVIGVGVADILTGLARLEHAALETSRGQRVMLHVPTLLTHGMGDYVRRVGADLLTRQDNQVVVDGGYPGTGPAGQAVGATAWAYATTPVAVRITELQLITDPSQTVDRATNTVTAWAERVFAATFDPCLHLATEITV